MIGWWDSGILGRRRQRKRIENREKQVQEDFRRERESEGRKGIGLHEYETGVRVLLRKASLSEEGIKERLWSLQRLAVSGLY